MCSWSCRSRTPGAPTLPVHVSSWPPTYVEGLTDSDGEAAAAGVVTGTVTRANVVTTSSIVVSAPSQRGRGVERGVPRTACIGDTSAAARPC